MADSVPQLSGPITIVGEEAVTATADDFASLPSAERDVRIDCNSGDHYTATWRGVSLADTLELAAIPGETTHVVVASSDGYRVCIDVETAADALLAFFQDGRPLAAAEAYESRFVSDGVDGPRTAKDVERIEAVTLEPGEDPEAYENLLLMDRD